MENLLIRSFCAVFCFMMLFIGGAASLAHAQGVFGAPSANNRAVKLPEIDFDRDNVYFRDLLTLQRQIALLEKMKEREGKIDEIIDAYSKMGLDMDFPSPNRDWCEQIPPNLTCAYHYPNMYEDYDVKNILESGKTKPQKQDPEEKPVALPPRNPLEALGFIPMEVAQQTQEEKELLKEMVFVWTKINCLAQSCRAVISPVQTHMDEQGNEKTTVIKRLRYTIRIGDVLPDGRTVVDISAKGVNVIDDEGITTDLEPAPQS